MLEAMARAYRHRLHQGGIPELLPPEDLVPPATPRPARKIRDVTTDPWRMARMSARNLHEAREYRGEISASAGLRSIARPRANRPLAGGSIVIRLCRSDGATVARFFTGQIGYLQPGTLTSMSCHRPVSTWNDSGRASRCRSTRLLMPRRVTPLRDSRRSYESDDGCVASDPRSSTPTPQRRTSRHDRRVAHIGAVRIYHMHGLPFTTATGPRRAVLRWSEKVPASCLTSPLREPVAQRAGGSRRAVRSGENQGAPAGSINGWTLSIGSIRAAANGHTPGNAQAIRHPGDALVVGSWAASSATRLGGVGRPGGPA